LITEKKNTSQLTEMVENIKKPFLILDKNGLLYNYNKEARSLFNLNQTNKNLFTYLENSSAEKLSQLIKDIYENDKLFDDRINIKLKYGFDFYAKVHVITTNSDDSEKLLLVMVLPENNVSILSDSMKIVVNYQELPEKIWNKKIIEIIEEIKTIYPFTFIGKQKIQKDIDELEEMFWITDPDFKYSMVNFEFARAFGLKKNYFPGKNQIDFVPAYLSGFYESVQKFIKDNLNMIIVEGVPFNGINITDDMQMIEIPIGDSENNLVALVGIVQKRINEYSRREEASLDAIINSLIKTIPLPSAIIEMSGKVKYFNEKFGNTFSISYNYEDDIFIKNIFDIKACGRIDDFLKSEIESDAFDAVNLFFEKDMGDKNFKVLLNRFSEETSLSNEVLILLEDNVHDVDIEKLINNRGKMFDLLVKSSPEPIFIYDTENLRFLEVNDAAVNLYGYKRDEFLQMDLTDLYTPEDIQTLLDASNKEGEFTGPWRHRKKDGSSIYVEINKHSFKYNNTNAHFNFVKDVTEKLELEKDKQMYQVIFENSSDILIVTDNSGFITRANNTAMEVLGYADDEIKSISFTALIKDEERGSVNQKLFQNGKYGSIKTNIEIKHKNGNVLPLDFTITQILNVSGAVEYYNIIAAKPKEKEEVVKEIIKEVVVENSSSNSSSGVKGSNGLNTQFFSNIFHEILTPINVILGFVQEIDESIPEPNEEQKEAVDIINQNRAKLLQTMNSIAEYVELEQNGGNVKTEEVSVTDIIEDLQNDASNGIKKGSFSLGKISSSLKFVTDKGKFQTFINTFIKICQALAKENKIYLSAGKYGTGYFSVSVKDNPDKVSQKMLGYLEKIFGASNSAVSKDFGIPKIQINLVKILCKILNAEITIIEKAGEPSEFGFVFPDELIPAPVSSVEESENKTDKAENFELKINRQEAFETYSSGYEPEIEEEETIIPDSKQLPVVEKLMPKIDLTSLHCLYIEDQVDSQILFKVQLKELKDIKFAASFEEAVPLLHDFHFDFIVMDINLQGEYNGLDALKIIHRMPGFETLPIIAVTAYVLPGDREKFIAAGFVDFCAKPIFRERMVDVLEKLFSKQGI